jgi:hypothetical protein
VADRPDEGSSLIRPDLKTQASALRTCRKSTSRFGLTKSPTLQNPVGGATGVQYTRRSADGIAFIFAQPQRIHIPEVTDLSMDGF